MDEIHKCCRDGSGAPWPPAPSHPRNYTASPSILLSAVNATAETNATDGKDNAAAAEDRLADLPTFERIDPQVVWKRYDLWPVVEEMPRLSPSTSAWVSKLAVCTYVHDTAAASRLQAWMQHHLCVMNIGLHLQQS